jgi:hypothetical protein
MRYLLLISLTGCVWFRPIHRPDHKDQWHQGQSRQEIVLPPDPPHKYPEPR